MSLICQKRIAVSMVVTENIFSVWLSIRLTPAISTLVILSVPHFPLPHFQSPRQDGHFPSDRLKLPNLQKPSDPRQTPSPTTAVLHLSLCAKKKASRALKNSAANKRLSSKVDY